MLIFGIPSSGLWRRWGGEGDQNLGTRNRPRYAVARSRNG